MIFMDRGKLAARILHALNLKCKSDYDEVSWEQYYHFMKTLVYYEAVRPELTNFVLKVIAFTRTSMNA